MVNALFTNHDTIIVVYNFTYLPLSTYVKTGSEGLSIVGTVDLMMSIGPSSISSACSNCSVTPEFSECGLIVNILSLLDAEITGREVDASSLKSIVG